MSCRSWTGRLFQMRGPATVKLLSPKLLFVRRTMHVLTVADRSWRRSLSATSLMSSDKYAGDIIVSYLASLWLGRRCWYHYTICLIWMACYRAVTKSCTYVVDRKSQFDHFNDFVRLTAEKKLAARSWTFLHQPCRRRCRHPRNPFPRPAFY